MSDVIERHTLHGEFTLSSGGTRNTYIDLQSAVLCDRCAPWVRDYYRAGIEDACQGITNRIVVVATGSFGALLLSLLGPAYPRLLWNPKGHGVEWSGLTSGATHAVLVDDIVTTGATLGALRAATQRRGLKVLGYVAASAHGEQTGKGSE